MKNAYVCGRGHKARKKTPKKMTEKAAMAAVAAVLDFVRRKEDALAAAGRMIRAAEGVRSTARMEARRDAASQDALRFGWELKTAARELLSAVDSLTEVAS